MPNTVVFLWISAGALAPLPPPMGPSGDAAADLRDYGAAHGLNLAPALSPAAKERRPRGLPPDDASLVDSIESELEQARTALSALEEGAADARLSRVEGQLFAHPYLPQAAFLMGECLALRAHSARGRSPAVALALEARRAELEGARAPAFGEPAVSTPPPARVTLPVQGLTPHDVLELDGANRGVSRSVELGPGLHHVRVLRRGRVVFATFTEVVAEQTTLAIAAPEVEPCSAEDLLSAVEDSSPHVACRRWLKVRDESPGIGIAPCEHARCGPFVHWQRRAPAPFAPLPTERRGLPAWLGFAIAGATVAAAGTLVLWQAGAFERSRPSAARWEYGGLDPQGIRF